MKVTLIHGQNHKGSTYHIARMVAEKIGGDIEEFFLPRDSKEGCLGCYACLYKGREFCPHSVQIEAIFRSMLFSDVIVIGSPMRQMQKKNNWTPLDKEHWQRNGWLNKARPY